jgi:2-keto-3-deoxy-L-rhamnonate aldolase RhmA
MPIVRNRAKQLILQDRLALGFGVSQLRGAAAGMIAARSGFDWLFIDTEHGALTLDQVSQISIAALGQGVTPIIRVCKDALHEGTRALDNGAMGVVIPHIDTAAEARRVAEAFRFPPEGQRSWGGASWVHGLDAPPPAAAQAEFNAEVLVTVMIETEEAVANAASIAAVPGIDCLMFGTSDLTATMGIAGQLGHPRVRAAYEAVGAACRQHGKVMGMGGVYDEVLAPQYIALGARLLLSGSDWTFLVAGATVRSRFLRGLETRA